MTDSIIPRPHVLRIAFAMLVVFGASANARPYTCADEYTIDLQPTIPPAASPLNIVVNQADIGGHTFTTTYVLPMPWTQYYFTMPSGYHVASVDCNGTTVPADGAPHQVGINACGCTITVTVNPLNCPTTIVLQ